jgi:hypothetical protein
MLSLKRKKKIPQNSSELTLYHGPDSIKKQKLGLQDLFEVLYVGKPSA